MVIDTTSFKECARFPGYMISNDGLVYSTKTKRLIAQSTHRDGYKEVKLSASGKSVCVGVHRLVLEAWESQCPPGMQCRHMDGDPQNNHISNLRWGTRLENAADRLKHGRQVRGQRVASSKLRREDVVKIRRYLLNGTSNSEIARIFNVHHSTIWAIANGKTWLHVA